MIPPLPPGVPDGKGLNGRPLLVIEDDDGDFGLVDAYLRMAWRQSEAPFPTLLRERSLAAGLAAAMLATPAVILLDLGLPDAHGMPALKRLLSTLPGVPVVVFTGHDDDTLALEMLEAGAQDYIVKGQFDHRALARALRHALVRSRLESELRASKARLSLALTSSALGMWDCDLLRGGMVTSARWREMLGLDNEASLSLAEWWQRVHPDDREHAQSCMQQHVDGNLPEFECEIRTRHDAGHWVWVLARGRVVARDSSGVALRLIGTTEDVSREKRLTSEGGDLLRRIAMLIETSGSRPGDGRRVVHGQVGETPVGPRLSARQREVLVLIAAGRTSADIAALLSVSPATVVAHRRDLMRKLDLHSVAQLTRYAIEHGLMPV